MGKNGHEVEWMRWGVRFRTALKLKHLNLSKIAEALDMHESSVRSWVNGNREVNLADFFRLCDAADIDAREILFGSIVDEKLLALIEAWRHADDGGKKLLSVAANAVLHQSAGVKTRRSDSS